MSINLTWATLSQKLAAEPTLSTLNLLLTVTRHLIILTWVTENPRFTAQEMLSTEVLTPMNHLIILTWVTKSQNLTTRVILSTEDLTTTSYLSTDLWTPCQLAKTATAQPDTLVLAAASVFTTFTPLLPTLVVHSIMVVWIQRN